MNRAGLGSLLLVGVALVWGTYAYAAGATAPGLGTAGAFAVLAGSTITNTGPSVINGDLGLSPGTSVTGFPPGAVNGVQHIADAVALGAQADLVTAYNQAAGETPVSTIATELGGTTKNPGIYTSADGTFGITGALTLDAQGDPNAVFIFKSASTLITAVSSSVILANGAQACNVFWQVGSSATLGVNSTLKGNILASASVTLNSGARVEGRVLARGGAVTLDSNTVIRATCALAPVVTPAPVATTTATTTAPTLILTATTTTTLIPNSTSTTTLAPVATTAPTLTTSTTTLIRVVPLVATTPYLPLSAIPYTGYNPVEDKTTPAILLLVFLASVVFAVTAVLYMPDEARI